MSFFSTLRSRGGSQVVAFALTTAALFAVPVLAAAATDPSRHSVTMTGVAVTASAMVLFAVAGLVALVVIGRHRRS